MEMDANNDWPEAVHRGAVTDAGIDIQPIAVYEQSGAGASVNGEF